MDILNHLAAWLGPRRLSAGAAEFVEAIYAFALDELDPVERRQLTVLARRWTLDATWPQEGIEEH